MKNVAICFALLSVLLSGCAGYEKIKKSPDIDYKFEKAFELYEKGKYQVAADIFDGIVTGYRATGRGDSAFFFQAMSYYKIGGIENLQHASNLFSTFTKNFYSPLNEEADFMNFKCYYEMSPRPSLDQAQTYEASKNGQIFLGKYPLSRHKDEVLKMLSNLEEKLVEKSYISAKLYFQIGDYKASISALNSSLQEYPDSKYREELMFMLCKASYEYAANSYPAKQSERFQAALDEYYAFKSEFPESKNIKEANDILDSIQDYLKLHPIKE